MPIEPIVRAGESPGRSAGHRASGVRGVNDSPGKVLGDGINPQNPPYPVLDDGNDYSRWPQQGVTLANGEELASVPIAVSGNYEINPNVLSIWNLTVAGTSLSLSFTAFAAPSEQLARSIWNGARRVRTIQINVNWSDAGAKSVTISGIKWSDGEEPDWTATAGLDVLVVQVDSSGQLLGFAPGLDMR